MEERVVELGYREAAHQYLRICPTCYHLCEVGRPDGRNQHCVCPSDGERRAGYDDGQRVTLCLCCGYVLLPSVRSAFFCRECQLLAMGVSVWHLMLPMARERSVPSSDWRAAGTTEAMERVYRTIGAVSEDSPDLERWYRIQMQRTLRALGLHGGVAVRDYIVAVVQARLGFLSERIAAFDGLRQSFRSA